NVGSEPSPSANTERFELRPGMECIGGGNQGLGWHAPDAGAGRTVRAGVDQNEVLRPVANLAERRELGGAGADNGHFHSFNAADLHSLSLVLPRAHLGPHQVTDAS